MGLFTRNIWNTLEGQDSCHLWKTGMFYQSHWDTTQRWLLERFTSSWKHAEVQGLVGVLSRGEKESGQCFPSLPSAQLVRNLHKPFSNAQSPLLTVQPCGGTPICTHSAHSTWPGNGMTLLPGRQREGHIFLGFPVLPQPNWLGTYGSQLWNSPDPSLAIQPCISAPLHTFPNQHIKPRRGPQLLTSRQRTDTSTVSPSRITWHHTKWNTWVISWDHLLLVDR